MKLTVLGIGHMGLPMARRLLDAGHELHAWNRTRSRAEPLAAHGAAMADPAELAELAKTISAAAEGL